MDVQSKTKIDLYQLFEEDVLAKAGEFYCDMNERLADNRILPNLKFQAGGAGASTPRQGTAQAGSAVAQQPAQGAAVSGGQPAVQQIGVNPVEEAHQQELIASIKQLQEQFGGARRITAGGVDYGAMLAPQGASEQTFSENDFAFALSALQQKLQLPKVGALRNARPVEYVEKGFIDQLTKLSEGMDRNKIAQEDAKIVEIVGMLFNYVLDDPKLSDVVKALISHLHTPMLKVALIDKGFFNKAGHPARRFLNVMSEIGARWVTEEDEDRMVLAKLKAMVSRILDEFIDDLSIFDELYAEITKFAKTLEERAERIEKRQAESQKGLEKLAEARQQSAKEVAKRVDGQDLAPQVVTLLREPWTDFLAFIFLRHGIDSAIWRSSVKTIDGVIWSVQAQRIRRNPDSFNNVQVKLEVTLKRGLKVIGYEGASAKALLTELERAQKAAHELAKLPQEPSEQVNTEVESTSAAEQTPENSTAAVDNEAVDSHTQIEGESTSSRPTAISTQAKRFDGEQSSGTHVVKQTEQQAEKLTEETQLPQTKKKSAISRQMEHHQTTADLDEATAAVLKDLNDLEFGTWFEFHDVQRAQPLLLKLAWYSKVSDHYMFVNNSGVKCAVKNQIEFATGLSDGSIVRVEPETKSLMERALESIARKLKPAA